MTGPNETGGSRDMRALEFTRELATMFRQILAGFSVSLCNIVIHALVMTAVVRVVHIGTVRHRLPPTPHMIAIMIATVAVLMMAHASEVIVWSLAYVAIDAAPAGADVLYFAFVNYTTLGYGDVVPVEGWRLIRPITAMNGVLGSGWHHGGDLEVPAKKKTNGFLSWGY